MWQQITAFFLSGMMVVGYSLGEYAFGSSRVEATPKEEAQLDPAFLLDHAQLQWRADGKIDVLTHYGQPLSGQKRTWRWATVKLHGIEVRSIQGHLFIFLGDGAESILLGPVADQPCTHGTLTMSPSICALTLGFQRPQGSHAAYFTLSLIVGSEGGVATESRFLIKKKPQKIS